MIVDAVRDGNIWLADDFTSVDRMLHLGSGGGIWLGMGVFQFVDGTLFHLVLELHPVRESADEPWPYDAAWIGSSLLRIAIGALLLRRRRG